MKSKPLPRDIRSVKELALVGNSLFHNCSEKEEIWGGRGNSMLRIVTALHAFSLYSSDWQEYGVCCDKFPILSVASALLMHL